MKQFVIAFAITLVSGGLFAQSGEGKMNVNTSESSVRWVGKKVTGSHEGNISILEGNVQVNRGVIENALVTIDMTSITVTDEGMNDDMKGKLTGHLNSADFFNVEEHDKAMFQLTSFAPVKGGDQSDYLITGTLTIKGISNSISFPAKVTFDKGEMRAEAKLTFDRSKWNIRYGSGSFFDGLGDKMIYDDVEISFVLVARG